ncbi:MAG: hypothetical protein ABR586_02875 [Thermoplasmatota archaeon]
MPRRLRHDQEAASGVITFLVAGIIFVGSIGTVLVISHRSNSGAAASEAPAAGLNVQAKSLAQFLLDSPGFGADGTDWVAGGIDAASATTHAEGLRRLGLRDATASDPSMLNFSKFQNLRRAPYYANATDGYVNYEEARTDLGLENADLDFHVRAYPTLPKVADLLRSGHRDPNLRVTYIGDIDVSKVTSSGPPVSPTAGLTATAPTCAVSPITPATAPQAYRLSTTVHNGGSTATQFTALFTYKLGSAASESQNANSYLVGPGGDVTLSVDVPATTGRSCTVGSTVSVAVSDPDTSVVTNSTHVATAAGGATAAPRDLWVDSGRPYRLNTHGTSCQTKERSQVAYFGTDLAKNEWMALKVTTSVGGVVTIPAGSQSFKVPSSKGPWTADLGCLLPGSYVATLYYCGASSCSGSASTEQVTEQLLVVDADVAAYAPQGTTSSSTSYKPTTAAKSEVTFLNTLINRFCPTYFDRGTDVASSSPINGTDWSVPANGVGADDVWSGRCAGFKDPAQPGDVFPDSKQVMNVDLPSRLLNDDGTPRYDLVSILVAGSNIDQTAMTSQSAKGAVADWVLGGGTLLVFGSVDQNVNWLEPIFHSAIRSSSGAIGTPDPGHPLLHVPDELDYPHYDNDDRVWNFNGQTAQNAAVLFDNVVVEGSDPVTTLSNPGAFGNGRVILTTWMPNDVYLGSHDAATRDLEGMKLVNNMLMEGYQGLFLDYGPPLPSGTNVVPAVRFAQITVPDFVDPVQMSVVIFVFK